MCGKINNGENLGHVMRSRSKRNIIPRKTLASSGGVFRSVSHSLRYYTAYIILYCCYARCVRIGFSGSVFYIIYYTVLMS